MSLQLTGTIKVIFQAETYPSGFTKREFVVTTKEQYPQDVKIELVKDKTAILDSFSEGQEVTVHFNLKGNEFNGKYYVSLQGWKVEEV
jgi:hypothetical protein